ncbi:MAG: c-type cytochrome [Cocleimonas sp.]|nr:c-type cytochrome [Cocleimonas sp.]
MKLTNIVLTTLLISASQAAIAQDPVSQMMNIMQSGANTASDIMKSGSDTASNAMNSAINTTKDAVDSGIDQVKDTTTNFFPLSITDDFKWTAPIVMAIETGDPKKGKALAKKNKCKKCHGKTGISDEDDTPSIAGQIPAYTFKQLHDYKMKQRDSKSMYKSVKNLSNQEMIHLAAWYATQKPEVMAGDKKGKSIPILANIGDKKRFLLACDTCHDEDAMKRGFQTPIIEGQKPEHFIETMTAFKDGERANDHYKLMQSISAKLTENEIEDLAAYYATKPMKDEDD